MTTITDAHNNSIVLQTWNNPQNKNIDITTEQINRGLINLFHDEKVQQLVAQLGTETFSYSLTRDDTGQGTIIFSGDGKVISLHEDLGEMAAHARISTLVEELLSHFNAPRTRGGETGSPAADVHDLRDENEGLRNQLAAAQRDQAALAARNEALDTTIADLQSRVHASADAGGNVLELQQRIQEPTQRLDTANAQSLHQVGVATDQDGTTRALQQSNNDLQQRVQDLSSQLQSQVAGAVNSEQSATDRIGELEGALQAAKAAAEAANRALTEAGKANLQYAAAKDNADLEALSLAEENRKLKDAIAALRAQAESSTAQTDGKRDLRAELRGVKAELSQNRIEQRKMKVELGLKGKYNNSLAIEIFKKMRADLKATKAANKRLERQRTENELIHKFLSANKLNTRFNVYRAANT